MLVGSQLDTAPSASFLFGSFIAGFAHLPHLECMLPATDSAQGEHLTACSLRRIRGPHRRAGVLQQLLLGLEGRRGGWLLRLRRAVEQLGPIASTGDGACRTRCNRLQAAKTVLMSSGWSSLVTTAGIPTLVVVCKAKLCFCCLPGGAGCTSLQ